MKPETILKTKVSSKDLEFLIQEAKDYAYSTGFMMGLSKSDLVRFAPFCLFPSPFPEEWFLKGKEVQAGLNLLMHRVSCDTKFLKECLDKAALTDGFLENLLKILDTVVAEGYKQNLTLGILRMDYMLDTQNQAIVGMKQIEMNTISVSFASLATQINPIHRHVLKQMNAPNINYPESHSRMEIARGLTSAWKAYGAPTAAILFVVEDDITNFADQRLLEYAIYNIEPSLKVVRHTFAELFTLAQLKNYKLVVKELEIAVVYYRTGYTPEQFETEDAWSARLLLERSRAIQCPNVPMQLAGMKKIQQELTRERILEEFLPDVSPDVIQTIKTLFAKQYSLDLTSEGDKAVEMALATPERYVLKPQREGGGNNVFGTDIVKALQEFKGKDREAFVLMELVLPPVHKNYILREKQDVIEVDTVGELGIYGVILADNQNVLLNYEAGHLYRCKQHGVNEGGVVVGYGALNLPYLI